MKKVIIYSPTQNLMQSGRAGSSIWKLVFIKKVDNKSESLMGWVSSFETQSEVILKFSSKEEAVKYAQNNNLDYEVIKDEELKYDKKDITFSFSKNRNLYYY